MVYLICMENFKFLYCLYRAILYIKCIFKRKLKKVRREKTKLRHKMDLKMVIPGDKQDFSDDVALFNLNKIKNKSVSNKAFQLFKNKLKLQVKLCPV